MSVSSPSKDVVNCPRKAVKATMLTDTEASTSPSCLCNKLGILQYYVACNALPELEIRVRLNPLNHGYLTNNPGKNKVINPLLKCPTFIKSSIIGGHTFTTCTNIYFILFTLYFSSSFLLKTEDCD